MKNKACFVALIGMTTTMAQAQSSADSYGLQLPQKASVTVDQIVLHLTDEQRVDLEMVLKEMGAKVGDWKTYSPEMAPSKCTSVDTGNGL